MSARAVAYVQSLNLPECQAARVFHLLAELTQSSSFDDEDTPMGLQLLDADIPNLAPQLGIDAEGFRSSCAH
ncbi:hypothetical protein [Actinomadura coerulea]|uniref:hypothetical protein n=1 Tax=Actinomadura coerulea TaxID=46159 RepID=UPI003422FFC1